MKAGGAIRKIVRILAYVLAIPVFLVLGVVFLLYSSWAQEALRNALTSRFNTPELYITLKDFGLHFPLTFTADGVAVVAEGDTVAAVDRLSVDARLLPLLRGNFSVDKIEARNLRYSMGSQDSSSMNMMLAADSAVLSPLSVHLADLAVRLEDGIIRGGRFSLSLSQDTAAPVKPEPPMQMSFAIERLRLEEFAFEMNMLPTIDTLSTNIVEMELGHGLIDMMEQTVKLNKIRGKGLSARYLVPDEATLAAHPPITNLREVPDSLRSMPWTVEIDSILFSESDALYASSNYKPLPGLDFGYITLDSVDIAIHDFYNRETTVRLPLELTGRERCGVQPTLKGEIAIDSAAIAFKTVELTTPRGTKATANGVLGIGDMMNDTSLPLALTLDGQLSPADLSDMFPAFAPYFAAIPRYNNLEMQANAEGTIGRLELSGIGLKLNRCVSITAMGYLENCMNPKLIGGDIRIEGNVFNLESIKNAILEPGTAEQLTIPEMTLDGRVKMRQGAISGKLLATTKRGDIGLDADWNSNLETYNAEIKANDFPVDAFMPLLGIQDVTATVTVDGRGYSFLSNTTEIEAHAEVEKLVYGNTTLTDIIATASLKDGIAEVNIDSGADAADFSLQAHGNVDGERLEWNAILDGRYIDLYAFNASVVPSSIEVTASASASVSADLVDIKASLDLGDFFYRMEDGTIGINGLKSTFSASDSQTRATLNHGDMIAEFSAPLSLDSLIADLTSVGNVVAAQIQNISVNYDSINAVLPPFRFNARGGRSNLVNNVLSPYKMSLNSFEFKVDKADFLNIGGNMNRLVMENMSLDTIKLDCHERGKFIQFAADVRNRPGNMDEWHQVSIKGVAQGNNLGMRLQQKNIADKVGYDVGFAVEVSAEDSTVIAHFKPFQPIIAYRNWSINEDNFISYNFANSNIDANLHMKGSDSSLSLFTEDVDGKRLAFKLGNIHIEDWIAMNPFMPPMKGVIDADMYISRVEAKLTGGGSASVKDFYYGKEKVADLKADLNVGISNTGALDANAEFFVGGNKTMVLRGVMNDSISESPLDIDFSVIQFPLDIANPFLPKTLGRLSGALNGKLHVSGKKDKPRINGFLDFDSTAVRLAIIGTDYKFSEDKVTVKDNIVEIKDFKITACNENPLRVNGTVDLSDMKMNLAFSADNMMIVNSSRAVSGADIFGKGYISLDATASGSISFLQVAADFSVNSGTNLTYIMPDVTNTLESRSNEEMVQFVNFSDTTTVRKEEMQAKAMAMMLDAVLNIREGVVASIYLSTDGKNRVQLQSNGTLTYSMTPIDEFGRLSGRLNIDNGFVRYTPPLMGEKLFRFTDNNHIVFTGDMMNPTVSIHAKDVVKAKVNSGGQGSRPVNFDVQLDVTGSLNRMDVKFDLSTNEDMTIANELQTMSPEQRANQAMNLLLYGTYFGTSSANQSSLAGSGGGNLSSTAVNSFIASQLNSLASKIQGVDLSFGIDQYDSASDGGSSTTTSYSYQVSKALFNDRFKIVVGGKYSTDANTDENFSQNLINDISFEYYINDAHTMSVRLFRHTGFESILEGEITQTGVGFVYRRKLRRLGDMFLPVTYVRNLIRQQNEKLKKNNEQGQ